MEISQSSTAPKTWPFERGWPLFGAVVGGIIVTIVLNICISLMLSQPGKVWPWPAWLMVMVYGIPSFVRRGWQAWLLFRRNPVRFCLWTVIPVHQFFPDPLSRSLIGVMPFAISVFAAVILRDVRQRALLWIPASAGGIVLTMGMIYLVYRSGIFSSGKSLDLIEAAFGPFFGAHVIFAVNHGIFALEDLVCAAVLAWKMPPVKRLPERL